MGEGKVTFPSMGLRKGQYILLVTNPSVYLLFLEASDLISLKCACLTVWNLHVLCLKTECVPGSIMLTNKGSLRDQYAFVMVKFLCVRFTTFS